MNSHLTLDFHLTVEERISRGQQHREAFDLKPISQFSSVRRTSDIVQLARATDDTRLKKYIPIRYGRILENAFATFRGGAYVMAHDLAHLPRSGVHVQLCGDAHLGNFGLYASPERGKRF